MKVAINGFGRIGRLAYRVLWDNPEIDVVAINDIGDPVAMAHLLKYDSVHGIAFKSVKAVEGGIEVEGTFVPLYSELEYEKLPWADLGVDVVIEASGSPVCAGKLRKHVEAGAKKVVSASPCRNADATVVYGVNDVDAADKDVIAIGSSALNAFAPLAKVIDEAFGIERGMLIAVHAYTGSQNTLDDPNESLRNARAASMSIIPTSTEVCNDLALVLPGLAEKFDGIAASVPVSDGSLVEAVIQLGTATSIAGINEVVKAAAEGPLKGVLVYTADPIVSVDVVGLPASAVFDSKLTMCLGGEGDFIKCAAWFDNEMNLACRAVDVAVELMA